MTLHAPATARLGVVVVNYGTSALLAPNLAHLDDTSVLVVVVVDNYTSTGERAAVVHLGERYGWHVEACDDNLGFGGGSNIGVARAAALGAQSFLLLNPDAHIDSSGLARLRAVVDADPRTVVAPRIVKPDGTVWFDGAYLDLKTGTKYSQRSAGHRPPRAELWLTAACLLVSGAMWERVGGFDERYFLYWEDIDLSHRLRLAGGVLRVDEQATAVHSVGASQVTHAARIPRARAKSTAYYYYNIRNRLLFAAIHLDDEDRRRWRRTAIPRAYDVLMQGGRRQFLHPWPPLRAAATGIVEGMRLSRGPLVDDR